MKPLLCSNTERTACAAILVAGLIAISANAANFTVNSAGNTIDQNDGVLTFAEAIRAVGVGDTINFNIAGAGPFYIQTPAEGYWLLTNKHNVTINGYSQLGSTPNDASITNANSANLLIVLDSRNGPGGYNRLDNRAGFGDTEAAVIGLDSSTNVLIKGLAFLSRHESGEDLDHPNIYSVALLEESVKARVQGCWFGVDPGDRTTIAGGRSAIASFHGGLNNISGGYSSGLIIGTDGDGSNDLAEFNVMVDQEVSVHLQTPNARVSGNWVNLYPNGNLTPPGTHHEFIENGHGDAMLVGTDGNGVADASEANLVGGVAYDTFCEFWGDFTTNVVYAGNWLAVTPKGASTTNSASVVLMKPNGSIRIGSDLNGVSDAYEQNHIYNIKQSPFISGLNDSNNRGDTAATISVRGNILSGNTGTVPPIPPLPDLPFPDGGVPMDIYDTANFLSQIFTNATDFEVTLSVNSTATTLEGRVPVWDKAKFPVCMLDLYQADSAVTNAQGAAYLGTYLVDTTQDQNPAGSAFSFDITGLSLTGTIKLTATANFSKFPFRTSNAPVYTSHFSEAISVTGLLTPGQAQLSAASSAAQLQLTWTGNGFGLQSSPTVTGPWNFEPNLGNYFIGNTGSGNNFYRLLK